MNPNPLSKRRAIVPVCIATRICFFDNAPAFAGWHQDRRLEWKLDPHFSGSGSVLIDQIYHSPFILSSGVCTRLVARDVWPRVCPRVSFILAFPARTERYVRAGAKSLNGCGGYARPRAFKNSVSSDPASFRCPSTLSP